MSEENAIEVINNTENETGIPVTLMLLDMEGKKFSVH